MGPQFEIPDGRRPEGARTEFSFIQHVLWAGVACSVCGAKNSSMNGRYEGKRTVVYCEACFKPKKERPVFGQRKGGI